MATRKELAAAAEDLARRDRALARIVDAVGPPDLRRGRPRRERFAELARAICYQQLAGKAAATIHGRFETIFGGAPTAAGVLATSDADLRACGLSAAKAASIRDLAAKVEDGTVELDHLGRRSDERVIEELTAVRGIGEWTAQMFLMFQLGRLDVWPTGDLGVRNGYARIHSLAAAPTAKELAPLGDTYRPWRSLVAWYCWRAVDTVVPETPRPPARRRSLGNAAATSPTSQRTRAGKAPS